MIELSVSIASAPLEAIMSQGHSIGELKGFAFFLPDTLTQKIKYIKFL